MNVGTASDPDRDTRIPDSCAEDGPHLGLATTEELLREVICRFTLVTPGDIDSYRNIRNGLVLAEMLGGLDAPTRDYRTVR